ncbi:MAG TPA: 4-hydroxybenzoyl-CoA reductase subunit beta [Hyphomicrobiales bacterium]|nr:4-hydroxybenzoyl-CoA reductase subunit beta [Hyphomicrobiales bacterium]
MTEVLPEFRVLRPKSAEEAIAAHLENERARYISGGTDLVPNIRRGLGDPEVLVDLTGIEALKEISRSDEGTRIGAGVTLADLAENEYIAKAYPALVTAADSIAGPGHRAAGTVGGNLCLDTRCVFYNQSEWWRRSNNYCLKYQGTKCHVAPKSTYCHAAFSGDLAPALLVFGAEVEIAGSDGTRKVPLPELYGPDGQNYLALKPGEFVTAVHLPADVPPATYEKMRVRGAIDFPLAGVAVALTRKGEAVESLAVAVTGTNSRPFLVEGVEELVGKPLDDEALEQLEELVQKQVSPMRTTIVSPFGRRRIAAALARRQAQALYQR